MQKQCASDRQGLLNEQINFTVATYDVKKKPKQPCEKQDPPPTLLVLTFESALSSGLPDAAGGRRALQTQDADGVQPHQRPGR